MCGCIENCESDLIIKLKYEDGRIQYIEKLDPNPFDPFEKAEEFVQWTNNEKQKIENFLNPETGFANVLKNLHDRFPEAKGQITMSKKNPEIVLNLGKVYDLDIDLSDPQEIIDLIDNSLTGEIKPIVFEQELDGYKERFTILGPAQD
jgi:hypothetical protein